LICKLWRDEKKPDDWKVELIVPLFKKGDKMKCENYRGKTLLIFGQNTIKHHIGAVERILGIDFWRVPMGFQATKKNNGPNILSKTDTRKILLA
jgi:hypothetical protein